MVTPAVLARLSSRFNSTSLMNSDLRNSGVTSNSPAQVELSARSMFFAQSSPTAMFSSDHRLMLPRLTAGLNISVNSSFHLASACA